MTTEHLLTTLEFTQPTRASTTCYKNTHTFIKMQLAHTDTQTPLRLSGLLINVLLMGYLSPPQTLQQIINPSLLDRMIAKSVCQSVRSPIGQFIIKNRGRIRHPRKNLKYQIRIHTYVFRTHTTNTYMLSGKNLPSNPFCCVNFGHGRARLNSKTDLNGRFKAVWL